MKVYTPTALSLIFSVEFSSPFWCIVLNKHAGDVPWKEFFATLAEVKGRRTSDLPDHVAHEAVHRDDLLLLA